MTSKKRYGVIGNPIQHSLSPAIHQQFAAQFNQQIDYQRYLVQSLELVNFVRCFFSEGGQGLNVTLPHKQTVIPLLDGLTKRAQLTQSVNTIYRDKYGNLMGDSTDGAGLLLDLQRLKMSVGNKKILVIGAGGASLSIIVALLNAGAKLWLYNRTEKKIDQLVERYAHLGEIKKFESTTFNEDSFDGVISSVSEFNSQLMQPVVNFINQNTYCYDLNYAQRANDFKQFALAAGCTHYSDGLGMLVGQAALAYQLWFGDMPDIDKVKLS